MIILTIVIVCIITGVFGGKRVYRDVDCPEWEKAAAGGGVGSLLGAGLAGLFFGPSAFVKAACGGMAAGTIYGVAQNAKEKSDDPLKDLGNVAKDAAGGAVIGATAAAAGTAISHALAGETASATAAAGQLGGPAAISFCGTSYAGFTESQWLGKANDFLAANASSSVNYAGNVKNCVTNAAYANLGADATPSAVSVYVNQKLSSMGLT